MSANLNIVLFTHTKLSYGFRELFYNVFFSFSELDSINNHPFSCLDILPNVKEKNRDLEEHKGEYDDRMFIFN